VRRLGAAKLGGVPLPGICCTFFGMPQARPHPGFRAETAANPICSGFCRRADRSVAEWGGILGQGQTAMRASASGFSPMPVRATWAASSRRERQIDKQRLALIRSDGATQFAQSLRRQMFRPEAVKGLDHEPTRSACCRHLARSSSPLEHDLHRPSLHRPARAVGEELDACGYVVGQSERMRRCPGSQTVPGSKPFPASSGAPGA
jgi:hypothetical protein